MKIFCKTLKEWEDFGLLAELPENRKEMVANCYNIVMDWLTKDDTHEEEIEFLLLPVFYRIAKIVDLTKEQVLETCKEFQQAWLDFDPTKLVNVDDSELYLVKSFVEMKINQYKTK